MDATKTQLMRKVARLESMHDQLVTELRYIDVLLRSLGFPDGLASAKLVAEELKEHGYDLDNTL